MYKQPWCLDLSLYDGKMASVKCKEQARMSAYRVRRKCWEMSEEDAMYDDGTIGGYVSGICCHIR